MLRSPVRARTLALAALCALASCRPAGVAEPPAPPPAPPPQAPRVLAVASSPPAYAFPERPSKARPPVVPPLALTASDGSGLELVALDADAVLDDPLALTQLHLVFHNPEGRTREGTFSITLPEGASIARFAMKIGGAWQEAEVVEQKLAREAYEDFLHRRQDPALLEHAAGNQFSARVFPIPPSGDKEIVVTYAEELRSARGYALPLSGLPPIGRARVAVSREGEAKPLWATDEARTAPKDDVRVPVAERRAALVSGTLLVARVEPVATHDPDPLGPTLVLVDTSASRALGLEASARAVERVARAVTEAAGPSAKLSVVAFDQEVAPIFEGEAGALGERELGALRAREALGASDLERALAFAADRVRARGLERVVIVGDGVATAGATEPSALRAAAARLAEAGARRVDAIVDGGVRDEAALRAIVTAGLPHDGIVVDATADDATLARRLGEATRSAVPVRVEGASWSWPERLDGVQAGDDAFVYAHLREGAPVDVTVGGVRQALSVREGPRALLERAVARAKIASLAASDAGEEGRDDVRRQIVALATRYHVQSPFTSLLVLETDRDYERFGIARATAPDLLGVDRGRVASVRRGPLPRAMASASAARDPLARADGPTTRPPPARARPADVPSARGNMWGDSAGESFGAGGLGLSGVGTGGGSATGSGVGLGPIGTIGRGGGVGSPPTGAGRVSSASPAVRADVGQGFGSGHGRLSGSHATRGPSVSASAAAVSGRLPPEVIQRIVRQRMGALRRCADAAAARAPTATARMLVRFRIGADGAVTNAERVGGDADAALSSCVLGALRSLTFPAPESGDVTVTYPFTFSFDGASPATGAAPPDAPQPSEPPAPPPPPPPPPKAPSPYTGHFADVMDELERGATASALAAATAWHRADPGDLLALVALGESLEASGAVDTAARAYGSIVDLYPARADLRRFAGEHLDRLAGEKARAAARDTYEKAAKLRPDHPSSHRLLAWARLRAGDPEGAFAALERGLAERYPDARFAGVRRILAEDLGLVAAAWKKSDPSREAAILERLAAAGAALADAPSLRFVLSWESDANDVDLHVHDAEGNHAFYSQKTLPTGGSLFADVTTGYGPECFSIPLPRAARSPSYALSVHYYSRGPMGFGMGKLEVVDHDGHGGLTFEERLFVVMRDKATVELGTVVP
jgi:hypothetical protein